MTSVDFRQELETKLIKKAWEDEGFKNELLVNPKEAIQNALELLIPADINIKVVEETPNTVYFVLPANPIAGKEEVKISCGESTIEAQTPWTY